VAQNNSKPEFHLAAFGDLTPKVLNEELVGASFYLKAS
jgi:hypothetical protein